MSLVAFILLCHFFARAKKWQKETRVAFGNVPTHLRSRGGKRELAPRLGSSLKQRVLFRPAYGMRDGTFPARPAMLYIEAEILFSLAYLTIPLLLGEGRVRG